MTHTVQAGATTAPAAGPLKTRGRRTALLLTIQNVGGIWTTSRVQRLYRGAGVTVPLRATARHDLQYLARVGWLVCHDTSASRHYTMRTGL